MTPVGFTGRGMPKDGGMAGMTAYERARDRPWVTWVAEICAMAVQHALTGANFSVVYKFLSERSS